MKIGTKYNVILIFNVLLDYQEGYLVSFWCILFYLNLSICFYLNIFDHLLRASNKVRVRTKFEVCGSTSRKTER